MPTPINSLVLHICRRSETEHASSKQKPSRLQVIRKGHDSDPLFSSEGQKGPDGFWPIIVQQKVVSVTSHKLRN